ncbi:hypothetical protein Adeg_2171 (plasmid) [Ammonifex degensii KC4]|uniref:Uncharacterized protein n=1 Tax=Ammonifex degensii (strain DSM 10501 / KC4) TaxID=429009 RepID=C9RDH7_AMMDK|nr:hypothetical protein [Ammonifex degensii]ACX53248.1 hypothetical protein Adeg_2171 [Ammonifex degensii KC4]
MRVYFPVGQSEVLEISWGDEKHEVTIAPPDGGLDLSPFRIPPRAPFTVSKAGGRLLTTTKEDLCVLDSTVELVRSSLCLDIQVGEESLYPVSPTTTFYADDIQMVVFAELAGVCRPLPMLVSWWYRKRPYFVTVGEIPPLPQESETTSLVRSCAFGFFIDPALPKGTWEVRLDLPTGRNLCRIEVRLLEGKRPHLGESGTLFRPKPEGGRMLDELG